MAFSVIRSSEVSSVLLLSSDTIEGLYLGLCS